MANKREPIKKSVRFEVFKRDKFTCQYCGSKAPDVVLHVDHIHPVAEGGTSDILNLVTACVTCNAGKGARTLSDSTALDKQRAQLESLQDRREQIEMMLAWRNELAAQRGTEVDIVSEHFLDRGQFMPNENGRAKITRWLKKHTLQEILDAADEALDQYLVYSNDEVTQESWELAFNKTPAIAAIRRQAVDKPYLVKLFYTQGILRKRLRNKWLRCVDAMEEMVLEGVPADQLELLAKRSDSWEDFCDLVDQWQVGNQQG